MGINFCLTFVHIFWQKRTCQAVFKLHVQLERHLVARKKHAEAICLWWKHDKRLEQMSPGRKTVLTTAKKAVKGPSQLISKQLQSEMHQKQPFKFFSKLYGENWRNRRQGSWWWRWWWSTWTSSRHCRLAVLGLSQSIMSPRKPDSPGWGFRTGKGFLAQKYISCQLPPVPFHFLTWGSGRPIKTEANIISTSIFGLLLSFLGSRLICFECDLLHQPWHKGWSIYQKEVRGSKQISAKNRLRQEMGSKQCQKMSNRCDAKMLCCQHFENNEVSKFDFCRSKIPQGLKLGCYIRESICFEFFFTTILDGLGDQ